MRKIIYIILDGLGDLACRELSNKTPLEAALTPHLDLLAQQGQSGIVKTFFADIAPESDVAVINLLGYSPQQYYTGRGPLEAFAANMDFHPGNVALRVNFATVQQDGLTIVDRRVKRSLSTQEAQALSKEINSRITLSGATFEFQNTIGHRAVLVLRGIRSQISGHITNTDPAYIREGLFGVAKQQYQMQVEISEAMAGYENDTAAHEAAQALNEFTRKSFEVLNASKINQRRIANNQLAANVILSRAAGDMLPDFASIEQKYGMHFGCFIQMPVERGIALLTGMKIVDIPQSTGHWDVDYPVWAKIAAQALSDHDGLYVHIKGPDEPGHDGDCLAKRDVIQAIDSGFLGTLLPKLDLNQTIICVTSDLSTVCEYKAHTNLPVPIVICGGAIKPDGCRFFSETAARTGALGNLSGQDVLPLLVQYAKASNENI